MRVWEFIREAQRARIVKLEYDRQSGIFYYRLVGQLHGVIAWDNVATELVRCKVTILPDNDFTLCYRS